MSFCPELTQATPVQRKLPVIGRRGGSPFHSTGEESALQEDQAKKVWEPLPRWPFLERGVPWLTFPGR